MIEEIFKENKKRFKATSEAEILEERTEVHEWGRIDFENLQKIEFSAKFQPYVLKIVEQYNKTILKIKVTKESRFLFKNYVDII